MTFIFLSYSHQDDRFVAKLRDDLVDAGQQVWRDREDIRRGQNWDDTIEDVLRSGQVTHVLFVQSEHSVQSEIVRNELQEALQNGIAFIIPLIIDRLTAHGLRVWMDKRKGIHPGDSFDVAIEHGIRQARHFVVVLIPGATHDDGFVRKELNFVYNLGKKTDSTDDDHLRSAGAPF